MKELGQATQYLMLHEVELGVVQTDIEHFITTKLNAIRTDYYLDDSWPSKTDIQALTNLSSGLFIFASTLLGS